MVTSQNRLLPLQTRSQSQLRENGKERWLMRLVCLDGETSGLTRILHFDPMSFRFPEEGQLPSLAPEGIVTLSSYLLEELLLREEQRVLQIFIHSYIKHVSTDDPRLMNVDDVDIIILVEKGKRFDSFTVDPLPRFFVFFHDENGKDACQAHGM